MIGRRAWAWLSALAAIGCMDCPPSVSIMYDSRLLRRLAADDPGWPATCDRPPSERIGLPPLLHNEPARRPLPAGLVQALAGVIETLPAPFARLFRRHVCAIVLAHDAPMTGTLASIPQMPARSMVLLNVEYLSFAPNQWLAFKEATAFAPASGRVIRGTMAEPHENSARVLMEFVLVHEIGHVMDAAFPDDPLIEDFKRISWPRSDALAASPLIHYPRRANDYPLPDRKIEKYYDIISAGAFASPATISNPKEDFAESLATFMHTIIRGRPWQLEVLRDGQVVRQLRTCWEEPRCREKRAIIEELLRRWSSG